MLKLRVILACLFVTPFISDAGVAVRILNSPGNTIPFAPYPVIGAIENNGPGYVLVPTKGVRLRVEAPDGVRIVPDERGCLAYDDPIWLKPGERHLFLYNVGDVISRAGAYRIQAELYSDGRCRAYLWGDEPYPVVPVFEEGSLPMIECWRGNDVSPAVPLTSIKPSSKVDEDALAYVLSTRTPGGTAGRFSGAYPHLRETFPLSEYTYVAGFWRAATFGGGEPITNLDEIQRLQPESRFAPYARLYRALRVIEKSAKAAQQAVESLSPIVPAKLDLPPVLREYVAQVLRDTEERRAHEESRSAGSRGTPAPAKKAP